MLFGHDPDNPQDIDPILNENGAEEQQPLDGQHEEGNLGYWVNGVFRPLVELTLEEQTNLARKIEFLDQMPKKCFKSQMEMLMPKLFKKMDVSLV